LSGEEFVVAAPLWAFVFLAALGVDYNTFLMTRVREEAERHGTRRGALIGLPPPAG
jgi:RND superfamily putative drug exporter